MENYTLDDVFITTDRIKLFVLYCEGALLTNNIEYLQDSNINVINIGKVVASYIDNLDDFCYLSIDVCDFIIKLLNQNKSYTVGASNAAVAIWNLGILLEKRLELNTAQILKEFSKTASLIIIWENQCDIPNRLHWSTQQNNIFLDFTDTPFKKLQYAI